MHNETTFVALYTGRTVGEAQIVALSAEEEIVEQFTRLLPRGVLEKAQSRPPLRLVPELEPDLPTAARKRGKPPARPKSTALHPRKAKQHDTR